MYSVYCEGSDEEDGLIIKITDKQAKDEDEARELAQAHLTKKNIDMDITFIEIED